MQAELLAPAGSYESMVAAVMAGADAVYMGGVRFGARAYADNLTEEKLKEAIDFCHLRGVRLYLTVNTLFKEQELSELYDFLAPLYEHGLDAVIVQDLGVLRYLRRQFPSLDIHASTQMTNQSADGAAFLEKLGVKRVVTSRELSLPEIAKIREETHLEIESFVHGALCYCYSGQCLLSSIIGGRSGNRGRCAQPCRLPYRFSKNSKGSGDYLLSPKDLCTLEILPEILEAGVYSLKIEGRMKRPEYTAGVVRIYRKYLDFLEKQGAKNYRVEPEDLEELMDLYNRGGFSRGYYKTRGNARMMSTLRPNHFGTEGAKVLAVKKNLITAKALEDLHRGDVLESATLGADAKKGQVFTMKSCKGMEAAPGGILHRTQNSRLLQELSAYGNSDFCKEKINGNLIIFPGKPVILFLKHRETEISVEGPTAERARNMALTRENVERQMRKTGNTEFAFENLTVSVEDGCFLPMQALNELRRRGIEALREAGKSRFYRKKEERVSPAVFKEDFQEKKSFRVSVSAFSFEQAEALIQVKGLSRIYLEAEMLLTDTARVRKISALARGNGMECFLSLPYLFRGEIKEAFLDSRITEAFYGMDGFLIRNLEELVFLKKLGTGKTLIADAGFYTYNQEARLLLREAGAAEDTAPLELNDRELLKRGMAGSELLVYGRIPLMVSSQCVKRTTGNCDHKKEFSVLKDRKGADFPIWNDCGFCYNILFNSAPHFLFQNEKEIRELAPLGLRLSFTKETPEEAGRIAGYYKEKFADGKNIAFNLAEFTRGHFKRGVE